MMRLNSHIGPVRTQMTNTQNMNISDMNMQNIPNLRVCYLYEIESKSINADETLLHVYSTDESESKSIIKNSCSLDKRESKIVRINANTSEVKYAMNETKVE